MQFAKYHASGNDYIVLTPADWLQDLAPAQIRVICHRHYGVGGDGILWGPLESDASDFGLRIFNPDGSEAEKSGNGLRIFARALFDQGQVEQQPFSVATLGGEVTCQVDQNGRQVKVKMGAVSFDSRRIPVTGPPREVLNETLTVGDHQLVFCAATVGNPHCVILTDRISSEQAQTANQ